MNIQELVTAEWENSLGVTNATPDDSFFDLGGNSVLAVNFITRVEQLLNISFPLESLFVDGTLQAVIKECESLYGQVNS